MAPLIFFNLEKYSQTCILLNRTLIKLPHSVPKGKGKKYFRFKKNKIIAHVKGFGLNIF
jgi:hypothetical protein